MKEIRLVLRNILYILLINFCFYFMMKLISVLRGTFSWFQGSPAEIIISIPMALIALWLLYLLIMLAIEGITALGIILKDVFQVAFRKM